MLDIAFLISAFIAGALTFLAPCTLPLVPAYLGFIGGVSLKDLEDPLKSAGVRRSIFLNGVFFIVGFSNWDFVIILLLNEASSFFVI